MSRSIVGVFVLVILTIAGANGWGQTPFSSGSSGAQGPFPPASWSNITITLFKIDLKTGIVYAIDGSGATLTAPLPGGASSGDAFPTGELDFTTFTLPVNSNLYFLPNTANSPISIRTTGDVLIAGNIEMRGQNGVNPNPNGVAPGGKGGPGGGDGGQGGSPETALIPAQPGWPGLGRNGGLPSTPASCAQGPATNSGGGGAFQHTNAVLLPLVGGSGGGGGTGAVAGGNSTSGGGGGGGGGAILFASSTKITVTGNIFMIGGSGGSGDNSEECRFGKGGGAGSGGAIRLIANRVDLLAGSLRADGGGGGFPHGGAGGPGIIRVEAFDIAPVAAQIIPPGLFSPAPGTVKPINLPRLRITSVGGTAVSDVGPGSVADVAIPSGSINPAHVIVSATNVPDSTQITVSLRTNSTGITTVSTTLTAGIADVTMAIPTGLSFLQAYTATFTVTGELQQMLPLYNGERIEHASVEFDGEESKTYFYTKSGVRVAAKDLFGGL